MTSHEDHARETGYHEGIDHAVRQVNEELERIGSRVRFVNAGLATVCMVDVSDPSWIQSREAANATQ